MSGVQESGGTDVGHHMMMIIIIIIRAVDHVGDLTLMRAFTAAEATVVFVEPSAMCPTKKGVQRSSGLWDPLWCACIQLWTVDCGLKLGDCVWQGYVCVTSYIHHGFLVSTIIYHEFLASPIFKEG